MSTAQIVNALEGMSAEERRQAVRSVLAKLYPGSAKTIERLLRRIEHPEVPEDVWEAFEEAEDGKGIEMRDEHFVRPPA
jgi:hypothetical protein